MTDEDVIRRVALMWGKVVTKRRRKDRPTSLTAFRTVIVGKAAIEWMDRIYPFMGKRRKERIDEVRGSWRAVKDIPRNVNRSSEWKDRLSQAQKRRWKGSISSL